MANNLKRAIDTDLGHLRTTERERAMILNNALGGKKVKRKVSVAFVLIMVLILLAVGALAAVLLSVRELVDLQAVPMANQSEGDSYSVEETNILLKLAQENGITLSEHARESINKFLSNGQGYYKEEMVMALAKAEFGEDPSAWTLEEQKWFDDVCVAIGFIEKSEKALPAADEITQEQAEKIAEEYIHSRYDKSVDLRDATAYKRGVQYLDGDVVGRYSGRYWTVFYEPLIVTATDYWIYISSRGEVLGDDVRPGYKEGDDIHAILNCFIGSLYSWEFGAWNHADIQFFCKAVASSSSTNDPAVLCIKQTAYPNISADAMSKEEAGRIAAKALNLTEDAVKGAVYIGDDPNPVWKVRLYTELPGGDVVNDRLNSIARYYVEVDSITGEVKNIYQRDNHYDAWHRYIVLQKVFEEVEATWVDTTPSVG